MRPVTLSAPTFWPRLLATRKALVPFAVTAALVLLSGGTARAADIAANPSNYRSLIPTLQPGDRLLLAAGSYPDGLPLTDLVGEPAAPIVLSGPEAGSPAVLLGSASRNTVSIRRSAHVTVRHLVLDGQSIPNIDAVKLEGDADNWAHHITLEHLTITNHDPNQQTVGISTKAPAWDWIIRHNVIHSAGTGLYLGNSDGSAPFVRGTIEWNLVADPEGYCMEIKHQNPRPSLSGMPPDGATTWVRHNVFVKDDDPSGSGDRPNVLIGHLPLSGVGQNDRYEIYGNLFYHNPREALFQGEGNLHLHDNLFVDAGAGWSAVNIRPHNDVPREVLVYQNTIYGADTGVTLTGADTGATQAVLGNAIFATTPLSLGAGVQQADNTTAGVAEAVTYVTSPTLDLAGLDLYPLAGGPLQGAALDTSLLTEDADYSRDFNGTPKDFTWRGAYQGGEAANPGWDLAESIKEPSGTPPDPDGGLPADAGPGVDASRPDGSAAQDAGVGGDGGTGGSGDGGGCGCGAPGRAGGAGSTAHHLFAALLLGFAWCCRSIRRRLSHGAPGLTPGTKRSRCKE